MHISHIINLQMSRQTLTSAGSRSIFIIFQKSDIQKIAVLFQRSVCLMSQYFLSQYLAQLNAFLIKAVYIPDEALEHDLVLKVCQQRTQSFRIQLITDDDAGGTSALEILVAVVICFTAGESYDLCSYVSAKLLLAGAALDIYICADLAVSETYKLQRNDVCSLMQQLVEGMLSVGSGLTEEYRTCHIVHRLTETVYRFTVGLHVTLLKMCREAA